MGRINILGAEVFNRIAAGEVVDGPYSAVKELIENSLDADATDIEIKIEGAGKQLIQVSDNGDGIVKDDLRTAFIPHATSKIFNVDDLDNIRTLGFRGEALASIASISQCEIVSRTNGNDAYKVYCEGQEIGKVQPAVSENGTTVTVRNLFFNTPVRAKFLRSDKKEESEITNYVTRYVLGNPDVSFRYYIDGKLRLQSYGGGLDEAVAQVYGASVISQCFKINAEKNGIKIHGFIGNQNFFKPNKSYQSVFLNGRNVTNNCIATALSTAYQAYAMKRQYPFYVLFIDVAPETVDVNVHPNKADVRFVDSQMIFGTVYKVIASILDGTTAAADFVVDSTRLHDKKSTKGINGSKNVIYGGNSSLDEKTFDSLYEKISVVPEYKENKKPVSAAPADDGQKQDMSVYDDYEVPTQIRKLESLIETEPPHENIEYSVCTPSGVFAEPTIEDLQMQWREREQQRIIFKSCKFKGTLFNTYLIYEMENDAYIIDQHAAHERLIYDRLTEKIKNRKVMRQGMLVPYIMNLNPQESEFISKNINVIRSMGFDITPFGVDAYRISEVPTDLQDIDIKAFFDELLEDLNGLKAIKLDEILKDRIATTACKHAVKGGMELTQDEVDKLFEMMKGDMGLKCPHGRPVCVKLTRRGIEKMFKRIV